VTFFLKHVAINYTDTESYNTAFRLRLRNTKQLLHSDITDVQPVLLTHLSSFLRIQMHVVLSLCSTSYCMEWRHQRRHVYECNINRKVLKLSKRHNFNYKRTIASISGSVVSVLSIGHFNLSLTRLYSTTQHNIIHVKLTVSLSQLLAYTMEHILVMDPRYHWHIQKQGTEAKDTTSNTSRNFLTTSSRC